MAAVAIGAMITIEDHAAHLGLVARMAKDWAELLDAMSKLAVISIRACTCLLPFVAKLSLVHTLIIHLQFKCFLNFLPSTHIHSLLDDHHKSYISI